MTEPNNQLAKQPEAENSLATEFEVFHLDDDPFLKKVWGEREERRQRMLEDEKWIKAHDELLAKKAGNAGRLFFEGREVAAWINDGTFKKKQFLEMYPEVAEDCSEWQQVLNLDALKKKYPEVYAANRARTMRVKNNPVVPS